MARGRPKKVEDDTPPQIVVRTDRQKRRAEPPLSERRVIKNSYRKKDEDIHFNMGFMPGNSYRCQKCRNGFALAQQAEVRCPNCGSTDLKPHSSDIIR